MKVAKERGCDALALTDTSNLYGALPFYKACHKHNIKPLIGVTLYVNTNTETLSRLVFLAKNVDGYKTLMRLVTFHQVTAKTKPPSIQFDDLQKFSQNLIAILPPFNSPVTTAVRLGNMSMAQKMLTTLQTIFPNALYAGIPHQKLDTLPIKKIEDLVTQAGIPCVPMEPTYYLDDEDMEARKVLLRIQPTRLSDIEEDVFENISLKLPSRDEIAEKAEKTPQLYDNLAQLVDSIDIQLRIGEWVFPKPPVGGTESEQTVLLKQYVADGLQERGMERTKEVDERIRYELSVIEEKKYVPYFLTMIDLVRFMHKNNILTSTRGSAAGSLVSYLTRITNVNPLEYRLPFERFLNPFRPSPPDVDIDVSDNRRSDIVEYIIQKYGKEKVAQIGTFGTMMARAAVRDTARALGYSYITGNRIARLIPLGLQGQPMTIQRAMHEVPELRALHTQEEDVRHIINTAKKIEGNARHISVHAAGIVIAPNDIVEYTPLENEPKGTGRPITQYNMHAVEDAGLLKFDLLGLTNLAILADALKRIEKRYGKKIDIDTIPLDDQKVFTFISDGYTKGIFQLGSYGMTSVLKRMKPNSIHDLAACIALYRPGPMKNIDEYIKRKHGETPTTYLHPKMEEYLKQSYGVFVYQEDLLYTALNLANYNWKEVDVFRKAVGKKIPELMAQQEKLFKARVMKHSNMTKGQADRLWNLFDPFKGYGFNKAHAMSYAKVSYQTAYIKTHYLAEYMAAHLTAEIGNLERIADLIFESKRLGIKIFPTDIQKSSREFTTEEHTDGNVTETGIRVGLETVRHVGAGIVETILEHRKQKPFENLEDFLQRGCVGVNKQALEALIKVGCLNAFSERSVLLHNLDTLLVLLKEVRNSKEDQGMLFADDDLSGSSLHLKPADSVTEVQGLAWEKDLLGFYVTGHPLHSFKRVGIPLCDVQSLGDNKDINVMGVITKLRPTRTKDGNLMYFITLEDDNNETLDAVCFSDAVQRYEEMLVPTRTVKLRGKTSTRNNEVTLRIQEVSDPQ